MKKFRKDVVGTSAIPSILTILSGGDAYGYQINKKLKEVSEGRIHWHEGSLYPILKKLQNEKFITSYWGQTEEDRSRKYYTITDAGRKHLEESREEINAMVNVLDKLWSLAKGSI